MIPLLPYEKRLAEILGVSEEAYAEWKAITLQRSLERPAEGPVCGPLVPVVVNLAVSVGLSLLSSLLFPASPARRQSSITVKRDGGSPSTTGQRMSPRFGFSSIQEPAKVGQVVPVVVAKRENNLGGVRVAMPLLWSQVLAYNGSLMFRGIFLAGAASMSQDAWDPRGWAFGNNTLGAYAYTGAGITRGSRYSIYYSRNGGRIVSGDLIAGREAAFDPGNFQNSGGEDVFSVSTGVGQYKTAFCMAETPSTSTAFGLYGWCPNAMMHRATVQIQPTVVARVDEDDKVQTDDDAAALVEIWKGKFYWSMRSGLRQRKAAGSSSWTTPASQQFEVKEEEVSVGDSLMYVISRTTDAETKIRFDTSNTRIVDNDASSDEEQGGVAASVAGIQNSADSALIPNELYRIGTCWAVLTERLPHNAGETIFISDSEQEPIGGGNSMDYVFTVVRPGSVHFIGPGLLDPPEGDTTITPPEYNPNSDLATLLSGTEGRYRVCSQAAQIFRMAVASIGAVREFKTSETIIKSRVGISVSGMTGFRSCEKIERINEKAGQAQVGKTAGGRLTVSRYDSSGSLVTTKTRRYSAFVAEYSADRGVTWTTFPEVFAVDGIATEDVYNYLRWNFSSYKRWERRLVPISSWEIRKNGLARIVVLDTNSNQEVSTTAGGLTISTTGYAINPTEGVRRKMSHLEPKVNIGLGWADSEYQSMFDGYARFAEAFCYDNVQASVRNAPEHEITHVNYYDDRVTPSYESLSIPGVNISASLEMQSLAAFSGFCNNGYEMPRLLDGDTKGPSHLFPDWLRERMTSAELGADPPTQAAQIDRASFQEAAQWCQDRMYFYDAVEEEPENVLEWAADTALAHLLKLVRIGGVYHLRKAIEFDRPLDIKGQFNNGNISEKVFKLDSVGYLDRQPFIVQVKWREETGGLEAPLFPRERVATVRQVGTSVNAPVKTLDLSKWCTNYKQAIDAACYFIRFVTLHDHRISFTTTPDLLLSELRSGNFFKLDIDVTKYNTAIQGFIQEDGNIVSTRPDLVPSQDGYYPGLVWDMRGEPQERDIVIIGGLAEPRGYFFAIANNISRQRTYEIKKVNISTRGVITINAFHHPVNENGMSLLGVNWTTYQTDANWIIEL
jgi:hypothetical protein